MKINSSTDSSFIQLASAKRINRAADDPSGLAISQKLNAQIKGFNKGTDNALTAKDLVNTAEGSLSTVSDSLQRIRELAVQASNGTNTADDRRMIQDEISQLKSSIGDAARNTEFNTMKVLDGSFAGKNIASGPSGTGQTMTIQNTSLETLGIDQFDVTQAFDIADIDNAIAKVNESRSNLGATANGIDHTVNTNNAAAANLTRADSQISDADMAKTLMDLKNQQIKQQVQIYAQQKKANQGNSVLDLLT